MGSSTEDFLARAEAYIRQGQVWRAKETLRGAIGSGRTDRRILERYGQILESLGDRVEAGKYLFLSGVTRTEYADPVRLFLNRHSRGGPRHLVAQFPTEIRRCAFSELPSTVSAELSRLGVTPAAFAPLKPRPTRRASTWEGTAVGILVLLVIVILLIGFIVGLTSIFRWVSEAIA